MKITVINGTEKHGVTYKMKEIFLEQFKKDAEITEYYLPKDCPNFCVGCITCFGQGEHLCKDAEYIQRIENKELKDYQHQIEFGSSRHHLINDEEQSTHAVRYRPKTLFQITVNTSKV